jgi:hypothetical protein
MHENKGNTREIFLLILLISVETKTNQILFYRFQILNKY